MAELFGPQLAGASAAALPLEDDDNVIATNILDTIDEQVLVSEGVLCMHTVYICMYNVHWVYCIYTVLIGSTSFDFLKSCVF